MTRLVNFAMFYIGWFACVAGAARGWPWFGPAVVAVLLAAHLYITPGRRREARLIALVGLLGFTVDSIQAGLGVYSFVSEGQGAASMLPAWLCPPWMTALWMVFASTLNGSMSWLAGRVGVAAAAGALFGPLSYLAGERLGAIALNADPVISLGVLAVTWAFLMPALLSIRGVVNRVWPRLGPGGLAVTPLAVLLLCAPLSGPAPAAEIEGVRFADRVVHDGVPLSLRCTGLLRYKVIFKGYVAALYLGPGVEPADVLGDVPKRLELSYFWGIDAADIVKAGGEILARNVTPETIERLRPRLERIDALYESVKPGDRYALTYVPGVGTELSLNGRSKGVIPGDDFAAAYFRIWLGERSIDASLRDQLLSCGKAA